MAELLNKANWEKTVRYCRKNGLKSTFFAALEKLYPTPGEKVQAVGPDEEMCRIQRERKWKQPVKFSLLVPAYNTPSRYLSQMLQSVLAQTYENWELILADASEGNCVEKQAAGCHDERIRYIRISENGGISANSNQGLEAVTGEYTVLLDHDDLLTKDALYEMASELEAAMDKGIERLLLYSDEDKCDENASHFYEVHRKTDFNLDLLLSNNYFCHLLVMKTELIKELGFRREYDGAQDYDLVLRAVARILPEEEKIGHVKKVLYHWRCHGGSTAANTDSKQYAYEAGRLALIDFLIQMGWKGTVSHRKHLGFYQIAYEPDLFSVREDVGAIGGCILNRRNKISGGIYNRSGRLLYAGLHKEFSGYMHRAVLRQEAETVDVRLMKVRPCLIEKISAAIRYPIQIDESGRLLIDELPEATNYKALSKKVCRAVKEAGYRIVWEPEWKEKIK